MTSDQLYKELMEKPMKTLEDLIKERESLEKMLEEKEQEILKMGGFNRPFDYLDIGEVLVSASGQIATHNITRLEGLEHFQEALKTFIELRKLDGVIPHKSGCSNHYISYCRGHVDKLTIYNSFDLCEDISPYFATEDHAKQAIDTIGEERLKHMFKVFAGIEV